MQALALRLRAIPARVRLGRLTWTITIALSWLIIYNTLPYFTFGTHYAFLVEKGPVAGDGWWRTSFYAHISGGMLCLATGPLLFWNALLRGRPAVHRWIGRLYVLSVLGWAGPAGVYLSLYAKGGSIGRFCFLLQVIGWWGTTAVGLQAILARRVPDHLRWMIRSYALALSAVFFRISQVALLATTGMKDDLNYGLSLWLSLAASVVAGEMMIRRRGLAPGTAKPNGGAA